MDYEKVKKDLRGPSVLIMAPFKSNYEIDVEALKEEIDFIIENGIERGKGHIICPCGTGEYVNMSREERKKMTKIAVEASNGKVPVVAGIGTCFYKEAIQLANDAKEVGAECVMIPPPFYYVIDQDEVYKWYKLIAKSVKISIMIYNQPWRNLGTALELPIIERISKIENIVSLKYASKSLFDYITVLKKYSKRFAIIDNSRGSLSTLAHIHGASGFITGPATFWPKFEAKYWSLLEEGRYREAEEWHAKLLPFWEFYDHGNKGHEFFGASAIKAAIEYVGIRMGPVRPPFRELNEEERKELYRILEEIGVEKRT